MGHTYVQSRKADNIVEHQKKEGSRNLYLADDTEHEDDNMVDRRRYSAGEGGGGGGEGQSTPAPSTHSYYYFNANEAPQEQPCSAFGLPTIRNEERINSLWKSTVLPLSRSSESWSITTLAPSLSNTLGKKM